jgi:hypothetical protein
MMAYIIFDANHIVKTERDDIIIVDIYMSLYAWTEQEVSS